MAPTERSYHYQPDFVSEAERDEILAWLDTLHPLWEQRYSTHVPPPVGQTQRRLLRPVYWLGNWQFACLGYYEPPKKLHDRAMAAEPFPPVLARMVARIEAKVRDDFLALDVPRSWRLDTCLVNFYGDRLEDGRWVDVARVGEHRDYEPGPVASVSIGERARFQFVRGDAGGAPVRTQWLEDRSLQVFAGPLWKDRLFHRVQRVEDKHRTDLPPRIEGFRTRRVNFTFRFVPDAHIVPFAELSADARRDVRGYVEELAAHASFFRDALRAEVGG